MNETSTDLNVSNCFVSDKRIKKIIKEIYKICINSDLSIYSNPDDIFDSFEHLNNEYNIEELPINIKIQICIVLSCFTSCFQCLTGCKRAFLLFHFLYDYIEKKETDNLILRFILYSKTNDLMILIDKEIIQNYVFISQYILYYLHYINDAKKETIFKSISTDKKILDAVSFLQKSITDNSIIKVSFILYYYISKSNNNDINWIATSVKEFSVNFDSLRLDAEFRLLPVLYAALISQTNIIDLKSNYINLCLSIACGLICCNNNLSKSHEQLNLSNLSNYDNIYIRKIRNKLNKNNLFLENKNYEILENLISQFQNDINTESITIDQTKLFNSIDQYLSEIDFLVRNINRKNYNLITNQSKISTQTNFEKQLSALSIFFENNIDVYNNIKLRNFVFLTHNNISRFDDFKKSKTKINFLCELQSKINHVLIKNTTIMFYGPFNINHDQIIETSKKRHFNHSDLEIKMNYYLNNFKMKYNLLNIKHIPFFNFLKINLNDYIEENESNGSNDIDILSKSLNKSEKHFNMFSFFKNHKDIDNKIWLVMSDPFGDYRFMHWEIGIIIEKGIPHYYNLIGKKNNNLFKNGKLEYLQPSLFFNQYVNDHCLLSNEVIKTIYMFFLYKAMFGIDKQRHCSDSFFIHLNTEEKTVEMTLMPHSIFSQPRYPPYNYLKRINVSSDIKDKTRKKPTYKKQNYTKENISDLKEKHTKIFFDNFNNQTLPLMHELYTFMNDEQAKQYKKDIPQSILDKSKNLFRSSTNKLVGKIFTILQNDLEYSIADSNETSNKCFFGCLTYFAAKYLKLDVNIFGCDLDFIQNIKNVEDSKRKKKNFFTFHKWLYSFVKKTSVLEEIEMNEFVHSYKKNIKPEKKLKDSSIKQFKGWLYFDGNIDLIIETLENWEPKVICEINYLEHIYKQEKGDIPKIHHLFNTFFNPDIVWLKNYYLPEVLTAIKQTKEAYQNYQRNEDFWNLCEFLFGRNFILLYLDYLNYCVTSIIFYYSKMRKSKENSQFLSKSKSKKLNRR